MHSLHSCCYIQCRTLQCCQTQEQAAAASNALHVWLHCGSILSGHVHVAPLLSVAATVGAEMCSPGHNLKALRQKDCKNSVWMLCNSSAFWHVARLTNLSSTDLRKLAVQALGQLIQSSIGTGNPLIRGPSGGSGGALARGSSGTPPGPLPTPPGLARQDVGVVEGKVAPSGG